ncbi:uncharacterized protein CEXT_119791 [Caerostris extrusa]|uniref:Uncharacterized protein n=1 Tax=Caerostris extrusa TaxID=172846 RepID=A0AAV4U5B9_CAEEX|nr:uncharacterized protein CEXT_119791 [Caerostris extrusa]
MAKYFVSYTYGRESQNSFLPCRCVRSVRRGTHREPPREVPVCPGRVLPHPVPQPADEVRQAAVAAAIPADGQLAGHRTAVLRAACGQDAHRDAHPGHAAQRILLQLAPTCRSSDPRVGPRAHMAHVHDGGPRSQEVAALLSPFISSGHRWLMLEKNNSFIQISDHCC